MQNQIFQSSSKFLYGKIKNQIWYIYLYIHLVENFNSSFKIRFQEAFGLKLINAKKMHYIHLTL